MVLLIEISIFVFLSSLLMERITIDAAICHGKPVIRGLRYPVEMIKELIASGMGISEILMDYPDLEKEDIYACIEYTPG